MKQRFNLARRTGRPVDPPAGASYAHEHTRPDGTAVVIARDGRGKLMRGSRLCDLREHSVGREPVNAPSVTRAALGIGSEWTERRRRGSHR